MRVMILSTLASRKAMSAMAGLVAGLVGYFGFALPATDVALGLAFLSTLLAGQAVADAGAAKPHVIPDTFSGAIGLMLGNLCRSKKHLATLAGAIVAGAVHYGFEADPELVLGVLGVVGTYVLGQGVTDAGRGMATLQRDHTATSQRLLELEDPQPAPPPASEEGFPEIPRRKPRLKL